MQRLHKSLRGCGHWALAWGIGMGLCTVLPSLYYKKPIKVAWYTRGAAVLATAGVAGSFSMAEAVGAFIVSAALITLCGVTGWFEKVMNRIPVANSFRTTGRRAGAFCHERF